MSQIVVSQCCEIELHDILDGDYVSDCAGSLSLQPVGCCRHLRPAILKGELGIPELCMWCLRRRQPVPANVAHTQITWDDRLLHVLLVG